MASLAARRALNVMAALVGLAGVASLAYGLGAFHIGSNPALRFPAVRIGTMVAGGLLILSALIAALSPRWRGLQAKLLFSLACVAVLLALAEVAARIAGYPAEPSNPRDSYWTADAEIGYVCQPNAHFRFLGPNGWVPGSTDAAGYRPSLVNENSPGIICLGDSTTFSTEVEDTQTWPEAAGRHLAAAGKPSRMINRGVAGYSGLQSLLTLRRTLARHNGELRAAVYHFCINDPGENFNNTIPRPLLQQTANGFDIVPPPAPWVAQISWLELKPNSALLSAFRQWRYRTDDTAYRSGAAASYFIWANECRRFQSSSAEQDGMRFVLKSMKADCDRRDIPLLVSVVNYPFWDSEGPSRSDFAALMPDANVADDAKAYHDAVALLKRLVEEAGGEFIDTRGCLDGMTGREYAASPYDWHFSAAANERIGSAIAKKAAEKLK